MSIRDWNDHAPTAQGADQTFEQVYRQYLKPVYTVAYGILKNHEDAEDIAHEVFLSFWKMENPERITNLKGYLFRMARNKALNLLRTNSREELTEDMSEVSQEYITDDEDKAVSEQIARGILRLPLEERTVFLMHVKGELKFSQIAEAMEMSLPAVYRKYRKAVKTLRAYMEENS